MRTHDQDHASSSCHRAEYAIRNLIGGRPRSANRDCIVRFLVALPLLGLITGCGTLPNGRRWAEDATLRPGWARVRTAAIHGLKEPEVWVPLAGSALMQIAGADEAVSDWARDHSPLYGSRDSARRAGDVLNNAASYSFMATTLTTPSGGEPPLDWAVSKANGFAVQWPAIYLTHLTTTAMKKSFGSTRPLHQDNGSFPSGHTSHASVGYTLAYRNLESTSLPDSMKTAARIGADGLTLATGWSRLEAGAHYPSDVMVGMALGHFIATFITDAFLGLDSDIFIDIVPTDKGAQAAVGFRF